MRPANIAGARQKPQDSELTELEQLVGIWVWERTNHLALPVVLHETFHLVTRICADKGITIRAHNEHGQTDDETAAYLFEAIARVVLRRCR